MGIDDATIFFGKYKGESICNIMKKDEKYIIWLSEQDWLSRPLRVAIEYHLGNKQWSQTIPNRF